jgi:putative hydrolase of the HAD superfamily
VRRVPKAILVDLDDTIIDDTGSVERCWRAAWEAAAPSRPGFDLEILLAASKQAANWYWSDPERHRLGRQDLRASTTEVVHIALISLGHDRPDLARTIAYVYRDLRDTAIDCFPGAIETLAELVRRGFRLALLTNGAGTPQRAKIERFALAPYFLSVHIEGEMGFGKPDERAYQHALRSLSVQPHEAWIVGDNFEWEVVVPQRLGLGTVWIDRQGKGLPNGVSVAPDHVIRSLDQILSLLRFSETRCDTLVGR